MFFCLSTLHLVLWLSTLAFINAPPLFTSRCWTAAYKPHSRLLIISPSICEYTGNIWWGGKLLHFKGDRGLGNVDICSIVREVLGIRKHYGRVSMTAKGPLPFAAPIQFGARDSRLLLHSVSIEGDPTQRSRSESALAGR